MKTHRDLLTLCCASALGLTAVTPAAAQPLPIFDAHMHYNVEAYQPYPVPKVLQIFEQNQVRGILANSRPNAGSVMLMKAAPGWLTVVPFIRVYRDRADYGTWFKNPEILQMIEREFQQGEMKGKVRGIGEFHLHGDEAKSPEFARIVAFAKQHDLWLHAHSDEAALAVIFKLNPNAKVIWAHTGFSTPTTRVAALLKTHPGLMGELSYRGDVSSGERLSDDWQQLLTAHPDRFLLGSDCWVTERWAQYGDIMSGYQRWLAQLPPAIAKQVAYSNAERMFNVKLAIEKH